MDDLDRVYEEWARVTVAWNRRRSLQEAMVLLGVILLSSTGLSSVRPQDPLAQQLLVTSWSIAALYAWNYLHHGPARG